MAHERPVLRGRRPRRPRRAGFPSDIDSWPINEAWNYERGRIWAQRVPASVALKRDGRVTEEAVAWFARLGSDIL
jgi:hypothetical protein